MLPGILSLLFVLIVVLAMVYRQYGGSAEKVRAQIRNKTAVGILNRIVYFLDLRLNGEDLRCETTARQWHQVDPGDFADITLMRRSFVRSLTVLRNLRPEERLRLQQEVDRRH